MLIVYLRVSTARQGRSGLGIEAQQAAVAEYAARSNQPILATYTECESGKRNDRPELARALAHAKRSRATIVIAKWDRLSRNLRFLCTLLESGVEFVATDNPHANRLTIHLLAAVAQHEVELISMRTKSALAAAKARGTLLGSARPGHWNGREDRRLAGARLASTQAGLRHAERAAAAYTDLRPVMLAQRQAGATLTEIAARLNAEGQRTRTGRPWNHVQVGRVLG